MQSNLKIPTLDNKVVWEPKLGVSYDWIDNHTFNGWLTFLYMKSDNGKLKYIFETHDGSIKYEVFPEDLEPMINHIDKGKIAGSFEYVKQGKKYGIKLVRASI